MIEFRQTMDQHAIDVVRDDLVIASIQWHSDKPPRIVWYADGLLVVDLDDVHTMVKRLHKQAGRTSIQ